jgi:chromosome transmission fidelity protein 1
MTVNARLGMLPNPAAEADEIQPVDEIKIFYCSRTHSQLAQFVREIRRVKLRPSPWLAAIEEPASSDEQCVKHLSLASRKNLCIHPHVSRLRSPVAINERCLELQQQGTPEGQKCSFLPTKNNVELVYDFRDHALAKIRDIEDLGALGKRIGICPYYATRAAIRPSEVSHKKVELRPIRP